MEMTPNTYLDRCIAVVEGEVPTALDVIGEIKFKVN